MKWIDRQITEWALESPLFPKHMSFILGPRQSGKSTLAQAYLKKNRGDLSGYFNFDDLRTKKKFLDNPYFFEDLQTAKKKIPLVFDEIHKQRKWKAYLKGAYDAFQDNFQFIVTGSGRLDLYQRGGDSLAGRYDPYFLFPLTPGEIDGLTPSRKIDPGTLLNINPVAESLLHDWEMLGGFPEPFLTSSAQRADRWWDQYQIRVTQEDVRDLTQLTSVDLMRTLLLLLPAKIGSPLSVNSLLEDLDTGHATVVRYLKTLFQLFMLFEVKAFSKKIHRAVRKEKKVYFFHHPACRDPAARLENMVALLLAKWCTSTNERGKGSYELNYLRDQDRREVDFVITQRQEPVLLFEVKSSDTKPHAAGLYYAQKLNVPFVQVVRQAKIQIKKPWGAIVSIHHLAAAVG